MSTLARLHPRARSAPASGIVSVVNYAREKPGMIPLWVGEGDLATPDFICDAAAASLKAGETFYTYQRGIPELREALARYTASLYGVPADSSRFFVTNSGMHAVQIVLASVAGPGDEVIFVAPLWPNLQAAAGIAGATAVEVPLDPKDGAWHLDLGRLARAITPRTRAIFVNTPNNPTGWTADAQTIRAIVELAREAGCFVIADEIYSRFYYNGLRAPSFHEAEDAQDFILYVNSFSKNWSMTGWRVGWIEAPAEMGDVIENLVQYSNSGVPTFIQRAAIAALSEGESFVTSQIERAHVARDLFADALLSTNRVELTKPEGAFYAFFKIDGIEDSRPVAFRIADEALVGLAPGTAFGTASPGFFRACFHRRLDQVEEAGRRLAEWIGRQA